MTTTEPRSRTLVDARAVPVTITTLPATVLPPADAPAPARPARLASRGPHTVASRAAGRRTVLACWAALAVTALAGVATAGLLAGHARLGLGLLAALGRLIVGAAVVVGLAWLTAATARVHCPGCRGLRR